MNKEQLFIAASIAVDDPNRVDPDWASQGACRDLTSQEVPEADLAGAEVDPAEYRKAEQEFIRKFCRSGCSVSRDCLLDAIIGRDSHHPRGGRTALEVAEYVRARDYYESNREKVSEYLAALQQEVSERRRAENGQ